MDREALLEKTKKELRSVLISAPRGVPARLLLKDYKAVTGKELPYRQLGFRSLDEFLRAIQDVACATPGPTGEPTYFGVANKETQQIARFVATQKKPKLRKSGAPPAAIIARTPVNRAAFTRKSRYGPRPVPRPFPPSGRYGRPGFLVDTPSFPPPPLLSIPPSFPALLYTIHHSVGLPHPHSPSEHPCPLPSPVEPFLPMQPHVQHRPFPMEPYPPFPMEQYPPPFVHPYSTMESYPLLPSPPPPLLPSPGYPFPPPCLPFPTGPYPLLPGPLQTGKPHTWTHSMPGMVKNIPPRFQKMTTPFPRPSSTGSVYRSPGMRSDSMAYQRNEWGGRNPSGMKNDSPSWKSGVRGDYQGRSIVVGVPAGYEDTGRDEWHISDESQRGWKSDAGLQKSGAAFRQRAGSLPSDSSQRVVRFTPEGIPPWKNEFEKATAMSINDLCEKASNHEDLKFQHLVRVIGWSGGMHKAELTKEGRPTHKFLLHSQYKSGRRVFPAIMLYFRKPFWDIQEFRDPISLGEEAKLRVYGYPFVQYSKKKNVGELALSVKYYEKMSSASGPSSTTSSPRESRSGSPGHQTSPGDIPATRKVDIREPLQLKVYELLLEKPGGIWGRRLSREYENKFGEGAPKDLMQKAKIMPFIKWEEVVEGTPILYLKEEYKAEEAPPPATPPSPLGGLQITVSSAMNGRVVQRETKDTVTSPTGPIPEQTSPVHPAALTEPQISPAALTEPQTSPVHPAALTEKPPPLPCTVDFTGDEDIYDVMVSNVCSLISFYVQRTGEGYLDKRRDMEQKLNEHFTKSSATASSVARDCLYGYCWWEEESEEVQWCRALVVSLESPQANVIFPDYGNSEVVDVKELKELPFEFYQLPFQAVHCCLHGMMEGMDSDKAIDKFFELAADISCVANIMDSSGSRVSVELMDPEVGETINSILLKTYHPIATLVPQLPTPGSSMVPIVLTDIDEDGVISVQVEGPGLNQLQQLMAQINEAYSKPSKAANFVGKVSKGIVCCAKFTTDQQWYRVQVKTTLSLKKVLVEYVDYGNEEELRHLKLRKALDTDLFSLPFQAVKCRLHGLPPPEGHWTDDAVGFVVGYMVHEDFHLEVVEAGEEGKMPSVKLFVKEGSNLLCLNELLLDRVHLFGLLSTEDPLGEREAEESPCTEFETASVSSHSSRVSDGAFEDVLTYTTEELTESDEQNAVLQSPEIKENATSKEEGSVLAVTAAVEWLNVNEKKSVIDKTVPVDANNSTTYTTNGSNNAISVPDDNYYCTNDLNVAKDVRSPESRKMNVKPGTSPVCTRTPPFHPSPYIPTQSHGTPSLPDASLARTPPVSSYTSPITQSPIDISMLLPVSPHTPPVVLSPPDTSHARMPPASPCAPSQSPLHQSPIDISMLPVSPHTPPVVLSPPDTSHARMPPASPHTPSLSPVPQLPHLPKTPPFSPPSSPLPHSPHTPHTLSSTTSGSTEGTFKYESLQHGKSVAVMVSWVGSPSDFVVQLLHKLNDLESMMEELNTYHDTYPTAAIYPPTDLIPGSICSASSGIDKRWYRAVVTGVRQTVGGGSVEEVTVEYLDYGGMEKLDPTSALRSLPGEYLELPFQGIHAALHGVGPCSGDVWSEESTRGFEDRVLYSQFFAVELNKDSSCSYIALLDTSGERDVMIHEELVRHKHAVKT